MALRSRAQIIGRDDRYDLMPVISPSPCRCGKQEHCQNNIRDVE